MLSLAYVREYTRVWRCKQRPIAPHINACLHKRGATVHFSFYSSGNQSEQNLTIMLFLAFTYVVRSYISIQIHECVNCRRLISNRRINRFHIVPKWHGHAHHAKKRIRRTHFMLRFLWEYTNTAIGFIYEAGSNSYATYQEFLVADIIISAFLHRPTWDRLSGWRTYYTNISHCICVRENDAWHGAKERKNAALYLYLVGYWEVRSDTIPRDCVRVCTMRMWESLILLQIATSFKWNLLCDYLLSLLSEMTLHRHIRLLRPFLIPHHGFIFLFHVAQ